MDRGVEGAKASVRDLGDMPCSLAIEETSEAVEAMAEAAADLTEAGVWAPLAMPESLGEKVFPKASQSGFRQTNLGTLTSATSLQELLRVILISLE